MTDVKANETQATSVPAPARATNGDAARQTRTRDAQQLAWDDRKMATSFANVVNIQTTREQVDLFFGTNQTWNISNEAPLSIELSNRVILSPFAAKRLLTALSTVIKEYEARYGALGI